MNYSFLRDIITLVESFETERHDSIYSPTVEGFCQWIIDSKSSSDMPELDWEGKQNGRSLESLISTLLVHMNKYAKSYSKAAIYQSEFSTQEEFIYLITLNSFGAMSKMDLIRRNKMDKPSGIQIINRLINLGWIKQIDSTKDRRSKILELTAEGRDNLNAKMDDIRKATKIVTADLSYKEKIELARILTKMDKFHQNIYTKNLPSSQLLNDAFETYSIKSNSK